jgi:hypothetical protein
VLEVARGAREGVPALPTAEEELMSGKPIGGYAVANATWPGYRSEAEPIPPMLGFCSAQLSLEPYLSAKECHPVELSPPNGTITMSASSAALSVETELGATLIVQEDEPCP